MRRVAIVALLITALSGWWLLQDRAREAGPAELASLRRPHGDTKQMPVEPPPKVHGGVEEAVRELKAWSQGGELKDQEALREVIRRLGLEQRFDVWQQLLQGPYDRGLMVMVPTVAALMHQTSCQMLCAQLGADLRGPRLTRAQKMWNAYLLSESATVAGIEELIRTLQTTDDPEMVHRLKELIVGATEPKEWAPAFDRSLEVPLLSAVQSASLRAEDSGALWVAALKIGSPQAVDAFLAAATQGDGQDRSALLAGAMQELRNPQAVPVLDRVLASSPPGSPRRALAADGLAAVGTPTAVMSLVRWAQSASDGEASLAYQVFSSIRDTDARGMASEAVVGGGFKSVAVRMAVAEAVDSYEGKSG